MTKAALVAAVALAFTQGIFGVNKAVAQGDQSVMKLAHAATAQQAIGKGMMRFAEQVGRNTGGKIKVDTYLASSLYGERTAIEALLNGAVDFAGAANANWNSFHNTLVFMDLPYVFRDEVTFRKVIDGPVGDAIRQRFETHGFKLLMILDNGGFRDIVNTKKPIRIPSDLKGMKVRTTHSAVEIAMFRNWGAVTTAIDWAEAYNALASGVMEVEFGMATWFGPYKHYEVLKHSTENKGVIGIQSLAMRKDRFDKLSPSVQKAILSAAKEAQAYSNKEDAASVKAAKDYSVKQGVKIYHPTVKELEIWRTTGRQIWKQFEPKIDKELLQMVLNAQEKM